MDGCKYCGHEVFHYPGCPALESVVIKSEEEILRESEITKEIGILPELKRLVSEYFEEADPEDKKVTDVVLESVFSKGKIVGSGNKGDFWFAKGTGLPGIKVISRPEKRHHYELPTIQEEAAAQIMAKIIAEKWTKDNPKKPIAKVPEIFAYVSDPGRPKNDGSPSEYLIMETVIGDTVSSLMYKEVFRKYSARFPEALQFSNISKDEYLNLPEEQLRREIYDIFKNINISTKTGVKKFGDLSLFERATEYYNQTRDSGIVGPSVGAQVHFLALALNNSGLFHRDLHERNVMVSPDKADAYVIDFGGARFEPALAASETRDYGSVYEDKGARLPEDSAAGAILRNMSKQP
jgi:serine/threonine protein kinase